MSKISRMKRLAGIGPMIHENWRRSSFEAPEAPASLEESAPSKKRVSSSGPVVSINSARIKRMANMLEDERMGGSHHLQFDWVIVERLMQEAQHSGHHQALAKHHWDARFASSRAHEADKAGDPHSSHAHHTQAAELHRRAAKHLAAAGDVRTARTHDQWAQHHDKHAAHQAGRAAHAQAHQPNKHNLPTHDQYAPEPQAKGGHHVSVEKDPFPSKKKKPPVALPSSHRRAPEPKKEPVVAPKHATSHWRPGQDGPEPTKPVRKKKDLPGYEGVSKETQGHAAGAHQSSQVAHGLAQAGAASQHVAAGHKQASHDHLHAALSLFRGGHHDKAMTHFNAAIHHANKHGEHIRDVAAQGRQAERHAAPVGPRARVGRTGGR